MQDDFDSIVEEGWFLWGYYWVFAYVLRDDYGLRIRGAVNSYGVPKHCWGVFNGDGVDYRGIRPESKILENCPHGVSPCDLTESDIANRKQICSIIPLPSKPARVL